MTLFLRFLERMTGEIPTTVLFKISVHVYNSLLLD
jgi:hypothetical protein